jgi:hypothetical protein
LLEAFDPRCSSPLITFLQRLSLCQHFFLVISPSSMCLSNLDAALKVIDGVPLISLNSIYDRLKMVPRKVSIVLTIQLSPCKSKRSHGAVDAEDSGDAIDPGSSTSVASVPKQLSIDNQRFWQRKFRTQRKRRLTVSLSTLICNSLSDRMHLAVLGEIN